MATSTDKIWEAFGGRLKGFILGRVRDEQDAQDILQEVFCKIHEKVDQLQDSDRLQAWVYQITRNAIIDFFRKRRDKIALQEISEVPDEEPPPPDVMEELSACLRPMINQLPNKYREAVLLTDIEGMTQKEMAERMGLSLSGAKSRVQRAREKLKDMLLECCHFQWDRTGSVLDYEPKEQACRFCSGKRVER